MFQTTNQKLFVFTNQYPNANQNCSLSFAGPIPQYIVR